MKTNSIVIGIYAAFILIGGIIGHQVSGSLASLISSSISSAVLFTCCYFIWNKHILAYDIAMGVLGLLFAFFCYRFYVTYKVAPAGILAIMSALLFIYLGKTRAKTTAGLQSNPLSKHSGN